MSIVDSGDITVFDGEEFQKPDTAAGRFRVGKMALGGGIKRSLDVVLSLIGILILLPLFLLVSAALKITSPGPVLFGHARIGYAGESFRCWKFRSMVTNGDDVLARHFEQYPAERHEWETNRKLKNDPRVTRLGRSLRAYSVDELPQLLNVLLGNMSLVGPRPVVKDELEIYGPQAEIYLSTRPGITGLWQTSGRSDVGYNQRITLDTEYVTNWSIWRDIKIMFKTIPTVISAEGSY